MDVFGGGDGVEFLELLFLDVVVSGGDCDDDDDGDQNRGALHPSVGQTFGENSQDQRYHCGSAENTKHLVVEVFQDLNEMGVTSSMMVLGGLTMGWLSP